MRIEDVIAEPPEFARTATVYDLLLALPKVGPAKAARSLTRCRIAPSRTLAGLTDRQRSSAGSLWITLWRTGEGVKLHVGCALDAAG